MRWEIMRTLFTKPNWCIVPTHFLGRKPFLFSWISLAIWYNESHCNKLGKPCDRPINHPQKAYEVVTIIRLLPRSFCGSWLFLSKVIYGKKTFFHKIRIFIIDLDIFKSRSHIFSILYIENISCNCIPWSNTSHGFRESKNDFH